MVLGRQWIACIASVLMTARFAAVNTGKGRCVAGIMQLIKRCEIEFANKPDVFVYGHIILLSNQAGDKAVFAPPLTRYWGQVTNIYTN
jgi:hypothetical protein